MHSTPLTTPSNAIKGSLCLNLRSPSQDLRGLCCQAYSSAYFEPSLPNTSYHAPRQTSNTKTSKSKKRSKSGQSEPSQPSVHESRIDQSAESTTLASDFEEEGNNSGALQFGVKNENQAFNHVPARQRRNSTARCCGATLSLNPDDFSTHESQYAEQSSESHAIPTASRGWKQGNAMATETIFRFDRHGDGWGEEIFPHFSVEQRPVLVKTPVRKNRGAGPDPWEPNSPELFLRDECGIPEDEIDNVMTTATAWRVTAGGRPLIDRRRRSKAARNLTAVAEYLINLGASPGINGVGKIFMCVPQIMLCKPDFHDRWDRRAIQLAYHFHINGNTNVSDEENPKLHVWLKKQRTAWQQGTLLEDRLQILSALGFEIGFEAQITQEWEEMFDQLLEWLLVIVVFEPDYHHRGININIEKSEDGIPRGREWLCLQWGIWGGPQGRRCGIWVQLQRELRAKGVLSKDAVLRLENLNFPWKPIGSSASEIQWLEWIGKMAYALEREKTMQQIQPIGMPMEDLRENIDRNINVPAALNAKSSTEENGTETSVSSKRTIDDINETDVKWQLGKMAYSANQHHWISKELHKNAQLLKFAALEPGLKYWLNRQAWNWRHRSGINREQTSILRMLGVDLTESQGIEEWRFQAHNAAQYLMDSRIVQAVPTIGRSQTQLIETDAIMPQHRKRMQVVRWILAQQALLADGQLSKAQLRYLVILDLLWIVNYEELSRMQSRFTDRLQIARLDVREGRSVPSEATMLWIRQQSALAAAGWLDTIRVKALKAIGVPTVPQRSAAEIIRDARISELLAYRAIHGNCMSPEQGWSKAPKLAFWLHQQQELWAKNKLTQTQVAQLASLGLKLAPPRYRQSMTSYQQQVTV